MEGLGVAANVIAVVDLSAKLVGLCVRYAIDVKNSTNDKARLMNEITALHSISQKAKDLLEGLYGARLRASREFLDAIRDGESQLKLLDIKLSAGTIAKNGTVWEAFKWPFESKNIDNIVQKLAKCTERISLTLQIDQATLILDMDQKMVLDRLPVAKGASFDSHDEQYYATCLPSTRTDVLQQISDWADDADPKPIFWLSGMAGTGKSTISRTVAQSFAKTGRLGASFFFKKGHADRGGLARFFTTIAAQLAVNLPTTSPHIRDVLDADPSIVIKNAREQFDKLFREPLSKAATTRDYPIIIVVDALDECESDKDIRLIIHLFSLANSEQSTPIKVFLTSRPDLPTRLGFQAIKGEYGNVVLHEVPQPLVKRDISVFLKHELELIRKEYNALAAEDQQLAEDWPGLSNFNKLVEMAVPLFIVAATICRFIGDRQLASPNKQLEKVISQAGDQISQLGTTYLSVLNNLIEDKTTKQRKDILKEFQKVVGSIVTLASPLSTSALARLLKIARDDIDNRLTLLHSVIRVPLSPEAPVRLLHLSFRDFLVDPDERGMPFWVDEKQTHANLATSCLQMLSCLKQDVCGIGAPGLPRSAVSSANVNTYLPPELQYACLYWVYHIEQAGIYICDDSEAHLFLRCHFLHWVESLALVGRALESLGIIKTLQLRLEVQNSNRLCQLLNDAFRFLRTYMATIDATPLQLYYSCIIFTPRKSTIRVLFEDQATWISLKPKVVDDWSQCIQTLEGHSSLVQSIAFSPSGQQLASGSDDKTIRLWDITTGICQQTLKGHDDWVLSVAFSPSGQQLASGSADKTIKLWDIATGTCHPTFKGHHARVNSIAFSLDGQLLASGSDDKTIKLWDIARGTYRQTLKGHSSLVQSIAFSPSGQQLISASGDKTIKLWDVATGICQQAFEGHSNSVWSVAFLPNGVQLASGSAGMTINLWDIVTGTCQQTLKGHADWVRTVAFSPDGQQLASGSADKTIKLWHIATGMCQQTLMGHDDWVRSVAFSPDGQQLASSGHDMTIKLWDIATGTCQQTLDAHRDWVRSVVFSPSGQQLISASDDKTIKLWDVATGTCQQALKGYDRWVGLVAFSPNSQQLASGSNNDTIKLWDVTTGICQRTLEGHDDQLLFLAFSPDGQQLASASDDKTIKLWDVTTGTCQHTINSCDDRVNSIAFSPDGQQLASGSADKTVRLWDIATGSCQKTLKENDGRAHSITFSVDSQQSMLCTAVERVDCRIPQYSLSHDSRWLLRDGEPMLWLPAEYKASVFATFKSVAAWGCPSGRVIVISIA